MGEFRVHTKIATGLSNSVSSQELSFSCTRHYGSGDIPSRDILHFRYQQGGKTDGINPKSNKYIRN